MKKIIILLLIIVLSFCCISVVEANMTDDELIAFFNEADDAAAYLTWHYQPWPYREDPVEAYEAGRVITVGEGANSRSYRPTNGQFHTMEDLKTYYLTWFSPSMIDKLMEVNEKYGAFREFDGKLYYTEDQMLFGSGLFDSTCKFEISRKGSDRIVMRYYPTYNASENSYPQINEDRSVYYDYVLEKNEDGKFVFTDFTETIYFYKSKNLNYRITNPYTDKAPFGENPQTADAPFVSVCLLALAALGAAVVIGRKKR